MGLGQLSHIPTARSPWSLVPSPNAGATPPTADPPPPRRRPRAQPPARPPRDRSPRVQQADRSVAPPRVPTDRSVRVVQQADQSDDGDAFAPTLTITYTFFILFCYPLRRL